MDTPQVHEFQQQLAPSRLTSSPEGDDASRYVRRALALCQRGHLVEAMDDAFRAGYYGPANGLEPAEFQNLPALLEAWELGKHTAGDESVFGCGYAFPSMPAPRDIEACQIKHEAFERGRAKGREHAEVFRRDMDKLHQAFKALDEALSAPESS